MARYGPEHKAKTRSHLVETARSLFREQGFDALSIDKLMRAAGLTRGAFYAHFESKEALVREVLGIESGLVRELEALDEKPAAGALTRVFDEYLSPQERAARVQCPFVAHPMDARRGPPERAELYATQVRALLHALEVRAPQADATLTTILALGAAALSSAVQDPELAARFESCATREIAALLAQPTSSEPSPPPS